MDWIETVAAPQLHIRLMNERYSRLESQFDEELSRADINVMALGHIHDMAHHVERLDVDLDQALLELSAGHLDSAAEAVSGASMSLEFLQDLVTRMRDITKQARVRRTATCDPYLALQELEEFLRRTARRVSDGHLRTLTVQTRRADGKSLVAIDEVRFQRIVLNLVTNASQWGAKNIKVELAEATGEYIRLVVEDDGIGIRQEIRSQIFDRLFTARKDGSGLGLYLVRRFAEEAGGFVELRPSHPHGTTFTVELPKPISRKGES